MGKLELFLFNSDLYVIHNQVFPNNEIKCLEKQYKKFVGKKISYIFCTYLY